jgi:fucose 4-O-acetylase-like acetyltransferase
MPNYDVPALADDVAHRKRPAGAEQAQSTQPPAVAQREEWPDLLRLPLMLGVLLIHAYEPVNGGALSLQGHDRIADTVMYLISQILARISVPIFFYFSGFFFFRQLGSAGVSAWTNLIRKRIRTLLVPFLLWNLLTLLAFLCIYKFGHGATHTGSVSEHVGSANLVGKIKMLFHHNGSPISYQFWFIRDLMICLLLSVLTIPLSQRWFGVLTAAMGAAWLLELWPIAVPAFSSSCLAAWPSASPAVWR